MDQAQPTGGLAKPYQDPNVAGGGILLTHSEFRGPIPHPDIIAGYDKIEPGLGARIVEMAMQQSSHRQVLEKAALEADIKDFPAARLERRRGQIIGMVIVLAALAVSVLVAVYGSGPYASPSAAVLGGIPLCSLVAVFITGKVKESKKQDQAAG